MHSVAQRSVPKCTAEVCNWVFEPCTAVLYFVFLYFVFVFEHLSGALCTVWQIAGGGGPEGCKASPITDDDEHYVDEYCDEE